MSIDPQSLKANWNYPTSVRFGPGRIAELASACRFAGIANPLIVTDPGLAGLPMIAEAQAQLVAAGLGQAVFYDVQGNPVEIQVVNRLDGRRVSVRAQVLPRQGPMPTIEEADARIEALFDGLDALHRHIAAVANARPDPSPLPL